MKKVVIVIPVYKDTLSKYEEISLIQCKKVFKDYPIRVLNPYFLNLRYYHNLFSDHSDFSNFLFNSKYFKSPQTYNVFLKSLILYEALSDYDFFLMYHTDAFVFRNEMEFWIERGYDIIGAPLYEYDGSISPKKYLGIGNSGFSLHNIPSSIHVLKSYKKVFPFTDFLKMYKRFNLKGKLWHLPYFMKMALGLGGWSHHRLNYSKINEDIFWGIQVPSKFPDFKVAPFEVAYKFSMEYNCSNLMQLNEGRLPFGCHQWYKGEFLSFWKDNIEREGYTLDKLCD